MTPIPQSLSSLSCLLGEAGDDEDPGPRGSSRRVRGARVLSAGGCLPSSEQRPRMGPEAGEPCSAQVPPT